MHSTTRITLLSLLALVLGVTGCDQNAFEEDYPDPESGLGPYVAFDATTITSDFGATFTNADQGLVITVDQTEAEEFELPVRLPTALGEDVTVTYSVSGDVDATEFDIAGDDGRLVIDYDLEDTDSFFEDLVVNTGAAAAGDATQTVTITLTGATTAGGESLTIGRFPDGRDQRVTFVLTPPAEED